eukprot:TRINITY_DN7058_c0_g1_i6.p1 TRINITY_DN7058_c0_g1~~TRINITY_DN7058_c0_g1_i6.p1  ORF type:complete len:585 (+),score=142.49 TRINITY_DN7058_c0_g1_i6:92-1756(+)
MSSKKLSSEEKQVLLEQKRKEEEQRKADLVRIAKEALKEKLEHEERYTRTSVQKLNAHWRNIMREAKSDELKRELEILSQTFERVLDRKEAVVQACLRDLNEAEEQEQMAARSHMRNVDRLIEFHREVVAQLQRDFLADVEELRTEFMTERQSVIEHHQQEMSDLKDITYAMQMLCEDRTEEEEHEFANRRDDMRSKALDNKTTLKANLEGQVKSLWDQFKAAMDHYESSTADKRAEFERLRNKDHASSVLIEQQTRRILKLQEKIAALKQRLAMLNKGTDDRNLDLQREKEAVHSQAQALKLRLKRTRARDRRALTQVAIQAKECEEKLNKKLEAAKQVLTLAEVCRKLESEEEKVLPFYRETITEEELKELEDEAAESTAQDVRDTVASQADGDAQTAETAAEHVTASIQASTAGPSEEELARQEHDSLPGPTQLHAVAYNWRNQRIHTYEALDNFWKRYNKVLLDRLAVERERALLQEENDELRSILKQYLDGISVSEDVLAQNNTLLIVNGRTNAPMDAVPVGDGRVARMRPTVQEVSHVMASTMRQQAV